jgi:hypothetical protein
MNQPNEVNNMNNIEDIVIKLSNNFTKIISRNELKQYKKLDWGNNGIGDRWANKKFNYTSIYNDKTKTYSENDYDIVPDNLIIQFRLENPNMKGIIGIFVHSKRLNITKRPIKKEIDIEIKQNSCVSCGSNSDIITDHKNDLYNDDKVLDIHTQEIADFQPLCNHCNLQKRQICKDEIKNNKIYSAKNLQKYKAFIFEFPWEKKAFIIHDITTKNDTYWYDPIEFNKKICYYSLYIIPIINEIKLKINKGKIKALL